MYSLIQRDFQSDSNQEHEGRGKPSQFVTSQPSVLSSEHAYDRIALPAENSQSATEGPSPCSSTSFVFSLSLPCCLWASWTHFFLAYDLLLILSKQQQQIWCNRHCRGRPSEPTITPADNPSKSFLCGVSHHFPCQYLHGSRSHHSHHSHPQAHVHWTGRSRNLLSSRTGWQTHLFSLHRCRRLPWRSSDPTSLDRDRRKFRKDVNFITHMAISPAPSHLRTLNPQTGHYAFDRSQHCLRPRSFHQCLCRRPEATVENDLHLLFLFGYFHQSNLLKCIGCSWIWRGRQ